MVSLYRFLGRIQLRSSPWRLLLEFPKSITVMPVARMLLGHFRRLHSFPFPSPRHGPIVKLLGAVARSNASAIGAIFAGLTRITSVNRGSSSELEDLDFSQENFWQIFESNPADKIKLLISGSLPDMFGGAEKIELSGSVVLSSGSFLRASGHRERVLILSSLSFADAVFRPSQVKLYAPDLENWQIPAYRKMLAELYTHVLRNFEKYAHQWNNSHFERFCVRAISPRPYHFFAYELRAYYDALRNVDSGSELSLLLASRSAFLSEKHADVIRAVRDPYVPGKDPESRDIIVSGTNPNPGFPISFEHWDWIRNSIPAEGKNKRSAMRVWLGITSGEKRYWLEENQALVEIVALIDKRYGKSAEFIFDGWTQVQAPSAFDTRMTDLHESQLASILEQAGLDQRRVKSLVGSNATEKIRYARTCDCFVTAGTPGMWPILGAGIPGVLHGSPSILKVTREIYGDPDSVRSPASQDIRMLNNQVGPAPLTKPPSKRHEDQFGHYSLDPSIVLTLFGDVLQDLA